MRPAVRPTSFILASIDENDAPTAWSPLRYSQTSHVMSQAHFEATIKVRHFLRVLRLSGSDNLLHLLGLCLDIFPQRNQTINCSFECANKWFRIES
jgi:hypothetical protein